MTFSFNDGWLSACCAEICICALVRGAAWACPTAIRTNAARGRNFIFIVFLELIAINWLKKEKGCAPQMARILAKFRIRTIVSGLLHHNLLVVDDVSALLELLRIALNLHTIEVVDVHQALSIDNLLDSCGNLDGNPCIDGQ